MDINKDKLKTDIEWMRRLEKNISNLINQRDSAIRMSERDGELFKFRYDSGDFNEWFVETFDSFKNHGDEKRIFGYYSISSYGTKDEKTELYKKEREIKDKLTKQYQTQIFSLDEELSELKKKYDKYFTGIMYDMEYDGGSPMYDFLQVALRIMEDYNS